ncbi:type VI secretion system ImpA family N-terminal domain-containing protein, partial [Jannaschia sp. LMIT008]|uniref:type VI secretion system ImpA family N-terminal domain-containing protein n=1 Tax=Jannaschia maritima TaxID=3032585 RepID=UPI002811C24C
MTADWLTEPVTDDAPCGPDLELAEDDDFLDYYYEAEGRLPDRYVSAGPQLRADAPSPDRISDPRDVDLRGERSAIDGLLRRSRDLRLLSLRARWEALAQDPDGFADAVEGVAAVLGAFGDAVHPALPDRARDRRAALEALANPATVLQPLQYLPLTGDPDVTFRRIQVARGAVEPRAAET